MRKHYLVGQRFGKWDVLSEVTPSTGIVKYVCKCDCGRVKIITGLDLVRKRKPTRSCGCVSPLLKTKMYREHPLYDVWKGMKARCYGKNSSSYKIYGLRGVRVCDEWRLDFKTFYDWCIKNGWEKGLQLDKDIKGNGLLYSPETCCFVSTAENCQNRRNNKLTQEKVVEIRNSKIGPTLLSQKYGVNQSTIHRIKNQITWKDK